MSEIYQVGEWREGDQAPRRVWRWREAVGYYFPRGLAQVARDGTLGSMEMRALFGLMSVCDRYNRCMISCAALGREVGLSRSAVSRALRGLARARCLIIETPPEHRCQVLTLSPALLWRGLPSQLRSARSAFDAAWRLRYALAPDPACDEPCTQEEASTPHRWYQARGACPISPLPPPAETCITPPAGVSVSP